VTGKLSVTDKDAGEGFFRTAAVTPVNDPTDGLPLGNLTITAEGAWEYTLDNSLIQDLDTNDTRTEKFTVESLDGTQETITITVNGAESAATIVDANGNEVTADITGTVTEDTPLTTSFSLNVLDDDAGEATFNPTAQGINNPIGTLTLVNGLWVYEIDTNVQANADKVQALGAGESFVEEFQVASADGTDTATIKVTVNGVNDEADIVDSNDASVTQPVSLSVTEDTSVTLGDTLEATVVLNVNDVDTGENGFKSPIATPVGNAIGSLTLSNGNWIYSIDNDNAAVQALGSGTVTDNTGATIQNGAFSEAFTVTSLDDTDSATVEVTVNGLNDEASFADDAAVEGDGFKGSVTESTDPNLAAPLSVTGKLTVDDADAGEGFFRTNAVTPVEDPTDGLPLGQLAIAADGSWEYTVDNAAIQDLDANDIRLEKFIVESLDGTETTIAITVNGAESAALIVDANDTEITAPVTGEVTEDVSLTTSFNLKVLDDDAGEAVFNPTATPVGNPIGTLTLVNGSWVYSIDTNIQANADQVQALGAGESFVEEFTVSSLDGTDSATIQVTVNGANDTADIVDGNNASVTQPVSAAVTEDDTNDGILRTAINISVQDVDTGENTFNSTATPVGNAIGSLTLVNGQWVYSIDNTDPAVQSLGSGQVLDPNGGAIANDTFTETFTVESLDGTDSATIEVTVNGVNDNASITVEEGDRATGAVTEDTAVDGNGELTTSGTLSISDPDMGEGFFKAVVTYGGNTLADNPNTPGNESTTPLGSLTINENGGWSYKINNSLPAVQSLAEGFSFTENFVVTSLDGSATETISITVNGQDDPAEITGIFEGTLDEDGNQFQIINQQIFVQDVDSADQNFIPTPAGGEDGTYGTFTLTENGIWTYTLDNDRAATNALKEGQQVTDVFTASIQDGTSQNITIAIQGSNDAPTAESLAGTLPNSVEDKSVVIFRPNLIQGIADPERDPMTIQNLQATNGVIEEDPNQPGRYVYTPNANFFGTETLSFDMTDGVDTTTGFTRTFQVTSVNDLPVGSPANPSLPSTVEDTPSAPFSVALLTDGFSDTADNDPISIVPTSLKANNGTLSYNQTTGQIVYTPKANFFGTDTITYTITDGKGGTLPGQTVSLEVTAVNDSPTGAPTGVIPAIPEDTDFTIDLGTFLSGFSDVDDETLDIQITSVSVGSVTDNNDGTFTYNPALDYNGPVEITYNVVDDTDGALTNQVLAFNVTPVNDAPEGPLTGTITNGEEDVPLTIAYSTLLEGFTDIDSSELFVQSLVPSLGTAANIVDNGDGTFTYTPPTNVNGELTFTYTVTDQAGGEVPNVTRTLTLAPVNDAPEGSSTFTVESLDENTPLTLLKSELLQGFSDPDEAEGDVLSVGGAPTVTVGSGSVTATGDNLGYVFTPSLGYNGPVTLSYNVTDGEANAPGTVEFEVKPINDPPGGSVVITNEVKQGVALGINTAGLTDPDGLTQVSFDSYQWQIAPPNPTEGDWQDITGATTANYTPTNEDVGSVLRVVIGYTDDGGFTNTVMSSPTGAIANANDQPTGAPTGTIPAGTEDVEQIIASATLLAGFSDPDGNETLSISDISVPTAQGTIVPDGANFKFVPAANYFGDATVTYTVTDGEFSLPGNTRTFTLAAVNDLPTVTGPITVTASEDDAPFSVNLLEGASDVENSTLTIDLALTEPIAGITLDGTTLNVDPGAYDALAREASQVLTFNYNVIDQEQGTTPQTATITITGANDAPEGTANAVLPPSLQDTDRVIAPSTLLQGFTDPDGDLLSLANLTANSGSVTLGENGNFIYQPDEGFFGNVTLTYGVTDGLASITGTQTFEVKSNQVPPNVFNFLQYVQFNTLDEPGYVYNGPSLALEIGNVSLAAIFDETYYLSQNPDIATAVRTGGLSSGYQHFVNAGIAEGRSPSLYYNEAYYLQQNSDVRSAVQNGNLSSGLLHYLQAGHLENRIASPYFDPNDYLLNNPDVEGAIINGGVSSAFEHLVEAGAAEGRLSILLFEESHYLQQNPDVAGAVENGSFGSGYEHYVLYGQKEPERNPGPLFDESDYLGSNPDVAAVVETGILSSGFEHFFRAGRAEGRPQFTPENFDTLG
jgi:VCBS repeat-containing protein